MNTASNKPQGKSRKTKRLSEPKATVPLTPYSFDNWSESHGMINTVQIPKRAVFDKLRADPDFWALKLYKIKVRKTNHTTTMGGMTGYTWPGTVFFETSLYWATSLAEAKKIGEVEEVVIDLAKARSDAKKKPVKSAKEQA